jgi:NADPH-dependent 2,4-dienoyl-CoA reductase/sulfur reductase-like enzyme/rhodanese-related sulfurtransferase
MKIVIVGGVAGGATAAARLRRLSEEAEIIVIERGEHISFANCGLPYHIGGTIESREELLLETPESFLKKINVEVRNHTEALSIDRENKKILARDRKNMEDYNLEYDYLILSPGANPFVPPVEGFDKEGVKTLRNVNDMDKIINYIEENNVKNAVVAGGGFIGVEMAENLTERGIRVSLVEMADQIMNTVDFEMASIIQNHMHEHGVNLILGNAIEKIEGDKEYTVKLSNNKEIKTDMVILSIGVRGELKLAIEAGLEIGRKGITVDRQMRTSDKNIFAVGDAVEIEHLISGEKTNIPLAAPANKQARIVANNIIKNKNEEYKGSLGTSIAKVFDMAIGSVGMNEKQLQAMGIDYISSITNSKDHAGYYPGASLLTTKILFNKDGQVLGGQVVGKNGVDKRIDVLATAISGKMTVSDLTDIDFAYAPPFGSAKDPLNVAGYVGENILNGEIETIEWNQLEELENSVLIDVRNPDEINDKNVIGLKNEINIPFPKLREKLDTLDKNKTYITYCTLGMRGYFAYRILKLNGFNVKNLNGGFTVYANAKKADIMLKNS